MSGVDSYHSQRHISTRLYSAIHVGSRWKIQDRREIKNYRQYTKIQTTLDQETRWV